MQDSLVFFYVIAGITALLIGLGKGGLGGTVGVLTTPLLSLVMPPAQALGLVLPILIVADVFAVGVHWNKWDGRQLFALLPVALAGILIGTYMVAVAPPVIMRRFLGIFVFSFVVFEIFIKQHIAALTTYSPKPWHDFAAGGVTGFFSTVAHAGGPPLAAYLVLRKMEPRTFAATSATFFALLNLLKIPPYFVAGVFHLQELWRILPVFPLLPLGVWLGKQLVVHSSVEAFQRIILVALCVAGTILLLN